MKRTKFPFSLWYYTRFDENLFDLDRDALLWFRLIVEQAEKTYVAEASDVGG